ncbi:alpha/beta fold hydrolase [Arcobacter arenosus]|jgi:pimeloyl-ACP methyl ester carboxylesterase|uniref:Alpha/beta hydrolase n=1 Tax=Arcobacter arenosus TaxID=2576037 RepID=A0A5R8XZ88_9BACT|nr:alpha/beta hydrolase [Arcobacter arenosus]TLP37053.1 alpha/beta hydrolase [Arcobacter arenosus]
MLGTKIIGNGDIKIIFLHELMGDCRNYEAIFPFLDKENFTYIFTDLRGYGLSKEIKGEYNLEEASNDVKNLITKLNLDEVILVSHSMSTMIAQRVALIEQKIKKLILTTPISASGIKVPEIQKKSLIRKMSENKRAIEQIVRSSSRRYNQTWAKYRIDMGYSSSLVEARTSYMNMYLNTSDNENDINEEIEVNIILGKHDSAVFAKKETEKNFSKYKNVNIIECQEAGHYPMIECPVFYASKIEELSKK